MRQKMTKGFCVAVVAVLLVQAKAKADHPQDILIIVNKSAAEETLSISATRAIFLKKRIRLQDGTKAAVINDKPGTTLRKEFQEKVLDMTANKENIYWQEQKIKKGISPPAELRNRLKAVYKIKGAISYLYRKDFKSGVTKVLLVLPP